jgi:hypothetical protein
MLSLSADVIHDLVSVGEDLEMEVVLNGFSSQGIIQYYKFT